MPITKIFIALGFTALVGTGAFITHSYLKTNDSNAEQKNYSGSMEQSEIPKVSSSEQSSQTSTESRDSNLASQSQQ